MTAYVCPMYSSNAIVVPAFNEETTIQSIVNSVSYAGDVIVIDDGSSDSTASRALESGAIVVSHSSNAGYDAAIESGLRKAESLGKSTAITFDADGQHDPQVLDIVLKCLYEDGCELVVGVRPTTARWAESVFNAYVSNRFGVFDILCGLKGYKLDLYRAAGSFSDGRSIGTALALYGLRRGVSTATVRVDIRERNDSPRFGSGSRANIRIIRAFIFALETDLKFCWKMRGSC